MIAQIIKTFSASSSIPGVYHTPSPSKSRAVMHLDRLDYKCLQQVQTHIVNIQNGAFVLM